MKRTRIIGHACFLILDIFFCAFTILSFAANADNRVKVPMLFGFLVMNAIYVWLCLRRNKGEALLEKTTQLKTTDAFPVTFGCEQVQPT
jgi:hypothetical protein